MPGRPRDATRDVAILDATLALLREVGYDHLSVEAVAARAGAGKATIYRRYPNKAALVVAAVDHRTPWTPPPSSPEDRREGLLTTLRWLAESIGEQDVGLIGALFAGMREDRDLAAGMRQVLARDQATLTAGLAGPGAALCAEIATALVVHRVVVAGLPCDEAFVVHLVDDVLLPVLERQHD